ncbi:MAG: lytic transglycosylase domain-containing protein [Terriglobia bacterium]
MRSETTRRILFLFAWVALSSLVAPADHIVQITNQDGEPVYVNTGNPARRNPSGPTTPFSSTPSVEAPPSLRRLAAETAREFRVDPALVDAVIKVESGYNPGAVSSKGAMGLMQLVPATARRFGVENPFNPGENIAGGVSYLRYLLKVFSGNVPLSLAAYNAGEHSVLHAGGIPAIAETVHYVRKVTSLYHLSEAPSATLRAPRDPPIVRTVDARGVIHFTNDGGF